MVSAIRTLCRRTCCPACRRWCPTYREECCKVLHDGAAVRPEITFICWKWVQEGYRTDYTAEHVNVWLNMVQRYCDRPARLICVTDDPKGINCETYPLWSDHNELANPNGPALPSCYRRLRIFDPDTTRAMGIADGDYVFSMDLDIVITRALKPLLDFSGEFIGWRGIGSFRPVVYNGSLFKFRSGHFAYLWNDFNPLTSPRETKNARYYGSDQAWLSYKFDGQMPGWMQHDGVHSYSVMRHKPLPDNAIIVAFNGKNKPWNPAVIAEAPWIKDHWQ